MKSFALAVLIALSAVATGTVSANAEPLSVHGIFGGNDYGR